MSVITFKEDRTSRCSPGAVYILCRGHLLPPFLQWDELLICGPCCLKVKRGLTAATLPTPPPSWNCAISAITARPLRAPPARNWRKPSTRQSAPRSRSSTPCSKPRRRRGQADRPRAVVVPPEGRLFATCNLYDGPPQAPVRACPGRASGRSDTFQVCRQGGLSRFLVNCPWAYRFVDE